MVNQELNAYFKEEILLNLSKFFERKEGCSLALNYASDYLMKNWTGPTHIKHEVSLSHSEANKS